MPHRETEPCKAKSALSASTWATRAFLRCCLMVGWTLVGAPRALRCYCLLNAFCWGQLFCYYSGRLWASYSPPWWLWYSSLQKNGTGNSLFTSQRQGETPCPDPCERIEKHEFRPEVPDYSNILWILTQIKSLRLSKAPRTGLCNPAQEFSCWVQTNQS